MHQRRLNASDRTLLETFTCRDFREPWTDIVQEVIRTNLPDELERDTIAALGAFEGSALAGVIVWKQADENRIIRSAICAVAHGHQRHGIGLALKQALLVIARDEGAIAVASQVHTENDAMLAINMKLSARLVRDPADPDYWNCILDID